MRIKRPLIDNGDGTHSVPLTRGQVAIIDSVDAERVGRNNWHAALASGSWYARCGVVGVRQFLHQELLEVDPPVLVDHANGNTLDNRRCNLRLATVAQNSCNSRTRAGTASGLKGAHLIRKTGRWRSSIRVDRKVIHLGTFATAQEAHAAYCAAAVEHHGEFARVS